MKKIISILLLFSFIAAYIPAFAKESVREVDDASLVKMNELPKTDFFDNGGNFHNRDAYKKWLELGVVDAVIDDLLTGNYAFVANCDYYWSVDHKEKSSVAAKFNEQEQPVVKSEIVNKLFGTKLSKKYVTPEEVTEAAPAWESFTDPRGFIFFSRNVAEFITTDIISEETKVYESFLEVSFAMGKITWQDVEPDSEEWEEIRQKILNKLTFVPGTEDKYSDYIDGIIEEGKTIIEKYNPDPNAKLPFIDTTPINCIGYARNLGRCYYTLKTTKRTDLDVEMVGKIAYDAIDRMFENYVGVNVRFDSNWFIDILTMPQMCCFTILYLRDIIPEEKLNEWIKILYVRSGAPTTHTYIVPYKQKLHADYPYGEYMNAFNVGANLFWGIWTCMLEAILVDNTSRVNTCLMMTHMLFEQALNSGHSKIELLKDGFYEDGSFLYHPNFAYNMGYGKSMLVLFADVVDILSGTSFDMRNVYGYEKMYNYMEKTWLPFIYEGSVIKRVQGRENPNANELGTSPIRAIMMIAQSGGEEVKKKYAKLLKPIVDESYEQLKNTQNASNFMGYYPAINETVSEYLEYIHNMPPVEVEPYNYSYYNMDMFVHKRDDYTFALAMSSDRVGKFEAINDGGYSDWYTGDGMTYTLKGNAQYIQRWWEYVDKYRIPGTTVGSNERRVGSVNYYTNVEANNIWSGGASDGKIGVAAMKYPTVSNNPENIQGTKSYFMLDDKIICLGTDITGDMGNVYTTVENYISYERPENPETAEYERGYVKVVYDGEELPFTFDEKTVKENPSWAWINDNRGFLFLGENTLNIERVAKNKRFCGNTGTAFNEDAYNYPFVTLTLDHGDNPQKVSYGYVLLPNKTEEETKALSKNPDFEILVQNSKMHAVKLNDGTVLANIFEPGELEGFKFLTPCSVIIKREADGYRLHVQEPTQKQNEVKIIMPEGKTPLGQFVTTNGNTAIVDVSMNYGRTYEVTCGVQTSSQSGEIKKSDKVNVKNISINMLSPYISTKLYASAENGSRVEYKIIAMPKTGFAVINGDKLYYYAPAVINQESEEIVVSATDSDGNMSEFTVKIMFR